VKQAVVNINANKQKYLQYFIDYHKAKDPEIGKLTVADLRAGRIVVCDPAPIPQEELERTAEWVKSWGMLGETDSPLDLVNVLLQEQAHRPAAE
jgi:NitT/TauT family transport system substrate-binding protein